MGGWRLAMADGKRGGAGCGNQDNTEQLGKARIHSTTTVRRYKCTEERRRCKSTNQSPNQCTRYERYQTRTEDSEHCCTGTTEQVLVQHHKNTSFEVLFVHTSQQSSQQGRRQQLPAYQTNSPTSQYQNAADSHRQHVL